MHFALNVSALVALVFSSAIACAAETPPPSSPPTAPAPATVPAKPAAKVAKELVPMPELTNAADPMKNLPIGPTKVSFTVENQTRLEIWDNKFLPNRRQYSNGVTYFRTRLSMDWDLHKHLRLFAQGQDARKDGDLRNQGRANENPHDLNELYLDLRKLFDEDLTIRVGRQPLVYGAQRLVGSFEWSNVGRRFDAVRVFWNSKDKHWSADAFASKVVVTNPEEVDEGHPTEEFYGLYLVNRSVKKHAFEFYGFYRTDDNGRTMDELRRRGDLGIGTLGGRVYGKDLLGGLDYEVEGAGQFGEVAEASHRAGAVHAEAGWTFKPKWKPRVMAEFNYASGDDDPTDGRSGAFNN
ncbi:MAG: alginate export family protein, partial [Planctomycetota bacterium]|nr:alginate export family protein [Planctomycetota bacterium]